MIYNTNIKLPPDRTNILMSDWEQKRLTHMSKNISKNDVIYYVGAECGDMPALCHAWGAEVALFEPSEHYWQQIKTIWEMNNFDDPLFFFSGFASNKVAKTQAQTSWQAIDMQYQNDKNLGFRELSKEADNFPQIKLDVVAQLTAKPSVISIDVEGAEFEVLKGAKTLLTEVKPCIYLSLHPEFLFDQWGVYANDVRNYLKDFGYKETLIDYPPHECHLYYE